MKKIEAIIRPLRLEAVKAALAEEIGITGLTVTDVRGCGRQRGYVPGDFRGQQYIITLPPKVRIEMVVQDGEVNSIIQVLLAQAHTGHHGDGKIFVMPMNEAVRIRTDDRGDSAIG